jgi:hypothetical protein
MYRSISLGVNMATIQDQSTYNHDGTTVGNPDAVAGYLGKGIDLDGSTQYITTPDSADLQVTTMTIMAWVYRRRNANTEVIYAYRDNTEGVILRFNNTGDIYFYLRNSASGAWTTLVGASALAPLNTWTHIAVTFDATTTDAKMYINGRLEVEGTGLDIPTYTSESTCSVGASSVDNGVSYINYFDGILDEIYVYSLAQTQCFINEYLFSNVSPHTFETKIRSLCPVHYWQLDELSGTEAIDETSVNESLTYQADASTMLDTASQFDGRGTSKDMTVAQIIDPAVPSYPLNWTESLHESPVSFGYNTEGTQENALVYNRYNWGDRIQDEFANDPFRIQTLNHGLGSNTRLDQVICMSKIIRRINNGGKYVFKCEYITGATTNHRSININSDSRIFNINSNITNTRSVCPKDNGTGIIGGNFESTPTWNTSWGSSDVYVFLDFDNETMTLNIGGSNQSTVSVSVLTEWVSVNGFNSGDAVKSLRMDYDPDLTGITLPAGTTINDWVGWNDWIEWQTLYEFYPITNDVSAWSTELNSGANDLVQGTLNNCITWTGILVSPDFTVPTTGNYFIVVQQGGENFAQETRITITVRIDDVDSASTFSLSNEAFETDNFAGGTIAGRRFNLNAGEVVNITAKADSPTIFHAVHSVFLVRDK